MRPPINKTCRALVLLLVALVPFAIMMALMGETLIFMVEHATLSRFLNRLPRILEPYGFGIWTVLLGIIVHSGVCWCKNPKRRTFYYMLLSFSVLGVCLILFLRFSFFFSMPGDGSFH